MSDHLPVPTLHTTLAQGRCPYYSTRCGGQDLARSRLSHSMTFIYDRACAEEVSKYSSVERPYSVREPDLPYPYSFYPNAPIAREIAAAGTRAGARVRARSRIPHTIPRTVWSRTCSVFITRRIFRLGKASEHDLERVCLVKRPHGPLYLRSRWRLRWLR